LEYSWSGFNSTFSPEDLEPYFEKYFDVLLTVYDTKSKEFANNFYHYLLSHTEDFGRLISRLEKLQEGLSEKYVFLQKNIKESIDDCLRKKAAHECFKRRAPLCLAKL